MKPTDSSELKCLNLGCGRRWHPSWQNVDFISASSEIRSHNLLEGIPYAADSFDVVYHSHLLEHLPKDAAPRFLRECHRVLRPGGILRVVVPDLENIVRAYWEALQCAREGKAGWDANYDWMVIELYDQTVRGESGGAWSAYLRQDPPPNREFVRQRVGAEAREMLAGTCSQAIPEDSFPAKLRFVMRNVPGILKDKWIRAVLSSADYEALQLGRFRRSGEIHLWMYDSYSLARLLRDTGFQEPRKLAATESAIPNWGSYGLDTEPDGSTYKPDSLFIEASKP